jgi:hypothetical protein
LQTCDFQIPVESYCPPALALTPLLIYLLF